MPARMRLRGTVYAGASVALAGIVILKALAQRPNFYSAAVYLSQSSANLMILTNMMFVIASAFMFGLQKLLYGPLRPIEVEQLYEKAWFAVTETCLAMTIFRGEIGPWFLIMFFALLAGKVWQWIAEGRVEILEQQPPRSPRLFHTRMALSLGLNIFFAMTMLEYVVKQVMRMAKPDMMVMFGFEFAVLSLLSVSTAARYAIQLVEIGIVREQKRKRAEELRKERIATAKKDLEEAERPETSPSGGEVAQNGSADPTTRPSIEVAREALRRAEQPVDENEVEVEGWEGKGRWVFYLDLTTDFFKLVLYLSFFIILLVFYGLPIHIMRDVFLTCRSFFKRISDFIKYRTATRDMNARYPDATLEEIEREEVCIICREEMRPYQPPEQGQSNPVAERMRPKKLPCGHVLHFGCLRSWLEQQQVCPTCRRSVVPTRQGTDAAGGGAAPGQHPGGNRPVARVFQLGPLRIGVGAARGENMFEELQQQMQENRAAVPGQPGQANLQQYQFGIRWGGARRRRRGEAGTIREQLEDVGRQLQQEMQSLAQSTREYRILQNAQLQLEALRVQQQAGQAAAGTAQTGVPPTGTQSQPPLPAPGVMPAAPLPVRTQSLQSVPGERILQAGSEHLPAGLTLPEGWSMMPLRPTTSATSHPIPTAAPIPPPVPVPPTFNGSSTVPVPEHIRAMFSNMPVQANVQLHQQPSTHHHNHQTAHGQPPPPFSGHQPANAFMNGGPTHGPSTHRATSDQLFQPLQDQLNILNAQSSARFEAQRQHQPPVNGQPSQPASNGISSISEAPALPPFPLSAQEQHERYLRSLRNPTTDLAGGREIRNEAGQSQHQGVPNMNGNIPEVSTHVSTNTINGTQSPEAASASAPAPSSQPPSLPSWGSQPPQSPSTQVEQNVQLKDNATAASEPESPNPQHMAKTATVEDLVEDPDGA